MKKYLVVSVDKKELIVLDTRKENKDEIYITFNLDEISVIEKERDMYLLGSQ